MAQVQPEVESWMETMGDEEAVADMYDLLQELRQQPANLNDTHLVRSLPLLSPLQQRAICNYILLYGQMLSLEELRFVPGFDSVDMARLKPWVCVAPVDTVPKLRLSDGRSTLVAALGGTVEEAAGYRSGAYEGDALRALLVYQYSLHNRISLRIAADKDPAEAWGKNNYYTFHLMLNDVGRVERLVAGRFNLQFGQGVTLWTGLRPFGIVGTGALRYAQGVRPAATFYEQDYQQGVATKLRLSSRVALSAFASHADGELMAGVHSDYRTNHLAVGATVAYAVADSVPDVRDYVYNQLRNRDQQQLHLGIDAIYRLYSTTFYGEWAVSGHGKPALLMGIRSDVADGQRIGLAFRYFDPRYSNTHAQPYTLGGMQGERGFLLEAESRLPYGFRILAEVDRYEVSVLRYGNYSPSCGTWLRTTLRRSFGSGLTASLRYSCRLGERNVPNIDSVPYLGEQTARSLWQADASLSLHQWRLSARGVYALFEAERTGVQQGGMVALMAGYNYARLQLTSAVACYRVDGYYARIYFSESNLQYAWIIPVLTGRGLRGYVVARYALGHGVSMAFKYGITFLPEQEAIGSGDSQTEGPIRQTWMCQLRWHF